MKTQKTIVQDDYTPDWLKDKHYHLEHEDELGKIYTKTILASSTMVTPFATFVVTMSPTKLFVRETNNNTFVFGIKTGEHQDASPEFPREEFLIRFEEFENKLNTKSL